MERCQASVRDLILLAGAERTDFAVSERLLMQAIEQARDVDTASTDLAWALRCLGDVCRAHLSDPMRAEALYLEALLLVEKLYGKDSLKSAEIYARLSSALADRQEYVDAERQMRVALSLQSKHLPDSVPQVSVLLGQIAWLCSKQGKMNMATDALVDNMRICERHGKYNFYLIDALDKLIVHYLQIGRMDEALKMLEKVFEARLEEEMKPPFVLNAYAQVMKHAGRNAEAIAFEQQAEVRQAKWDEIGARPGFGQWNILQHELDREPRTDEVGRVLPEGPPLTPLDTAATNVFV